MGLFENAIMTGRSLWKVLGNHVLGSQAETVFHNASSFDWGLWAMENRPTIEKIIGLDPVTGQFAMFRPSNAEFYDVLALDRSSDTSKDRFEQKIGQFSDSLECFSSLSDQSFQPQMRWLI